ncbi:isopentenyl phosphate kinase family protein [Halosimplex litoreum]|uniref:Isopentenyl phosphate kinase n=1 Tax=Halosimplex litoreum TaxID=1198301 RepID=A0A7T3FXU6_9EURY|nr:isopentenyl phosphate kinase [Halosimplex litoreum]QPV62288.1 isopentenyl phosphate kinase family protein [Halosimplex litoreum]
MTTVLKLGGSVVTEKASPETVDDAALARAAEAVADFDGDLVLVHGGGSFGHHAAAERGVTAESGTRSAADARAIHDAMGRLNAAVLDALHEAGVAALPVRPLSLASRDADGDLSLPTRSVAAMLAEGFVPVLHGDGVVQSGAGVTVTSGDDLVVALAEDGGLDVDRVGLCSTVPGVLDGDGEVIERIERFADAADALGGSDATDVTGGMAAKVEKLLALGAPAHVFGPEGLDAFVAGGSPGTVVRGE